MLAAANSITYEKQCDRKTTITNDKGGESN